MDKQDLEELRKLLEEPGGFPKPEKGDYAELLDEANLTGGVIIRRKSGAPILMMDQETYAALLQWPGPALPKETT